MPGNAVIALLWSSVLSLILVASAGLPPRVMLNGGRKMSTSLTLTEAKNTDWKPERVPITTIYAAPFIKHRIRMPKKLEAAVAELRLGQPSRVNHRANGQTAIGTNGL